MKKKISPKKSPKVSKIAERAHIFFEGRVQGVGFRYTTEKLALEIGLTGWVKNVPDGRVEVLCEGDRVRIEALVEGLKNSPMGVHIRKVICNWQPSTGEFEDFSVEFYL